MDEKSSFKLKLNRAGVRELLRSPEMLSICEKYANRAAAKLGDGYEVSTHTGKNRVNAEIAACTRKTIVDQKKNNTILKALR